MDTADALLRDAPWIQQLARSLVSTDADAEDLAHDAMVAALSSKAAPRGDSRQRRSWLRAILRNKAIERYDSVSRERFELERAKAERSESLSGEERLVLHRELCDALEQLPERDRDLLIRRHMDNVPPRTIAREQDLTSDQVRRRLHSARQRLREALERSERGAEGWTHALALLAVVPSATPLGAAGSVRTATAASEATRSPLLVGSIMSLGKLALVSSALIAAATVAWIGLRTSDSAEAPHLTPVADNVEVADKESMEIATSPEAVREAALERGPSVQADVVVAAPPASTRLAFVLDDGTPLPNAVAAWVTSPHDLRELKIDEAGFAEVAPKTEGRVFARHTEACTVDIQVPTLAEGAVHTITLPSRPRLTARVTVNGSLPERSITFRAWNFELNDKIERSLPSLIDPLEALGFGRAFDHPKCGVDGVLQWRPSYLAERYWATAPEAYLVHRWNGAFPTNDSAFPLRPEGTEVNLLALPSITGRFTWRESGEPAPGDLLLAVVDDEGYSVGASHSLVTDDEGRFLVPVHKRLELDRETRAKLAQRPGGIQVSDLLGERGTKLQLWPEVDGAQRTGGFEYAIDATTVLTDIGEVPLDRAASVEVRVLGQVEGEWRPIEAALESSRMTTRTDAEGNAHVHVENTDSIQAIAAGYDFVRVPVDRSQHGRTVEIRLRRAPVLEVEVPEALRDPTGTRSPFVRFRFEVTPFGSWHGSAGQAPALSHRLFRNAFGSVRQSGLSNKQGAFVDIPIDATGTARLFGLVRDARLVVCLMDHARGEYARQTVVIGGDDPGTPIKIGKWPNFKPARVTIHVTRVDAANAASGRYVMRMETGRGHRYKDYDSGKIEEGPLVPGTYLLTILEEPSGGRGSVTHELRLQSGQNEFTVDAP
ncbi:MAG: sigma-70 family RNA polymerase sigma factor [Planctomycetota bacterium]